VWLALRRQLMVMVGAASLRPTFRLARSLHTVRCGGGLLVTGRCARSGFGVAPVVGGSDAGRGNRGQGNENDRHRRPSRKEQSQGRHAEIASRDVRGPKHVDVDPSRSNKIDAPSGLVVLAVDDEEPALEESALWVPETPCTCHATC
jgi:hypothetical protein